MVFAPRKYFGFERSWISKAIKTLDEDGEIFAPNRREKAQLKIGIGIWQTVSLRDWLKAMKVIKKKKENFHVLTELGKLFLQFDRLVEEWGSWWTIHYQLSSNSNGIEIYHWFFNQFSPTQFSRNEMVSTLIDIKKDNFSSETIKRSVTSFLSVFRHTPLGDELMILKEVENGIFQRFEPEAKRLHPAIVAYAILNWAKKRGRSTVNVKELLSSDEAPGKVFGLSARLLDNYLDEIKGRYRGKVLSVSRTAGLNSVTYDQNIKSLSLLRAYYLERLDRLEPMEALRKAIKHG